MESPNVPHVLALLRERGLDFDLENTSFLLGRERILSDRHPQMPDWQRRLFAFMTRNAYAATSYFGIPSNQVVEMGTRVEL